MKNIKKILAALIFIIAFIAFMIMPEIRETKNESPEKLEIKSKLQKISSDLEKAAKFEYELYGNTTLKNGRPASKEKLVQMFLNQLSVVNYDENNKYLTLSDGTTIHVFDAGWLTVYLDSMDEAKRGDWICMTAKECEKLNPNSFRFSAWCGAEKNHSICPVSSVAYAYINDMSIRQAFRKFGNYGIKYE